MTSVKDRLDEIIENLLSEWPVNPSIPSIGYVAKKTNEQVKAEAAQALLALAHQEVMAALPEKSDPLITGLKFHNIDKDAGWNEAIDDMESRLKERLELAPTSKEGKNE